MFRLRGTLLGPDGGVETELYERLATLPHFNPDDDYDPLDPAIGVDWPTAARDGSALTPLLSPKDDAAPSLTEVLEQGVLASYEDCLAFTRGELAP